MAKGFMDICKAMETRLAAASESLGVLDNPLAKGEARESALLDFIAERLGTTFHISKAVIVDSGAQSSAEHDLVIYDRSVSATLFRWAERRVLRVETVAGVLEVKSQLQRDHADQFADTISAGVGQMTRYFEPSEMLAMVNRMTPTPEEDTEHGIGTREDHLILPRVFTGLVACRGPTIETALTFFGRREIDFVFVRASTSQREKPLSALPGVWGRT